MSQNCKMQDCQWYEVKRIKTFFREERELWKRTWGISCLPLVDFISSIKPISSYISLKAFRLHKV